MNAEWQKKFLTPLSLHLAGLAVFFVLNIVLGARLFLAWHAAKGQPEEQTTEQRNNLRKMDLENAPLRGLDTKIVASRQSIEDFYSKRIPPSDSAFVAELGTVAVRNHVRITRVQYTQAPALSTLSEIRMDASLSGDYASIMHFMNEVERDKTFFVIDALTLSGQQGGVVNLRMRMRTFLRPSAAAMIPVAGKEVQ